MGYQHDLIRNLISETLATVIIMFGCSRAAMYIFCNPGAHCSACWTVPIASGLATGIAIVAPAFVDVTHANPAPSPVNWPGAGSARSRITQSLSRPEQRRVALVVARSTGRNR